MDSPLLKDNQILMENYDKRKNANVNLDQLTTGSCKKVWWICSKGHSFQQTVIYRRDNPTSCPYCSGKKVLYGFNDLETVNPSLAKEWNTERNQTLTPRMVTVHSNKNVWWTCKDCDYTWQCKINDRTNGRGCPLCAKSKRIKSFRENYISRGMNDIAAVKPELLSEWDYSKNANKSPSDYTCHSNEKIWWKCVTCGYEWEATIANRANRGSGCPRCMKHRKTSFPEQAIYFYVLRLFPNAINSYKDIFSDLNTELDVYVPELSIGIEYDGKAWHNSTRSMSKAKEKYSVCSNNGIKLIRVSELHIDSDPFSDYYVYRDLKNPKGLDTAIEETLSFLSNQHIDIDSEKDRQKIMEQYITTIRDRSILHRFPNIVDQWDIEKNNGLQPSMVSATSNTKYWWQCEKGHSYMMSPANKILQESGCPICSNHQLLTGFNDLSTRYPQIANQWDNEKNTPTKACDVMPGSVKKYWWRCENGHSYQATPNSRTSNSTGCPICCGKTVLEGFNDLFSTHPSVSAHWNYCKNSNITPKSVTAGSGLEVWWICEYGHSWKKSINSQVLYNSCPICTNRSVLQGKNDLPTTHPDLIREWDFERNVSLNPENITSKSMDKVWWKCSICGHRWESRIDLRVRGVGCPKCGYKTKMQATRGQNVKNAKKDLVTLFPEIASEWDYDKNTDLDPSMISPGSNHKVWWICSKGHSYQAWITDRTGKKKTGCPYCAGKRKLNK